MDDWLYDLLNELRGQRTWRDFLRQIAETADPQLFEIHEVNELFYKLERKHPTKLYALEVLRVITIGVLRGKDFSSSMVEELAKALREIGSERGSS